MVSKRHKANKVSLPFPQLQQCRKADLQSPGDSLHWEDSTDSQGGKGTRMFGVKYKKGGRCSEGEPLKSTEDPLLPSSET